MDSGRKRRRDANGAPHSHRDFVLNAEVPIQTREMNAADLLAGDSLFSFPDTHENLIPKRGQTQRVLPGGSFPISQAVPYPMTRQHRGDMNEPANIKSPEMHSIQMGEKRRSGEKVKKNMIRFIAEISLKAGFD